MIAIIDAINHVADVPADDIRQKRVGPLRMLAAWVGWNEGLITLRRIAASLRLRSEGHISNLIRRCEQEFSADGKLLEHLDATLRMLRPA